MSFDLRRCSKADLDALNERARDWKAPQSKQSDQPQETPPSQESFEQLDLNLETKMTRARGSRRENSDGG
jgi:hypothetical protein